MSVEIGSAASCSDLLDKLNTFLTKGHTLTPQYTGAGTGLLTGAIGTATSVQEIITVTFTSSTAFNVVGGITGAMGSGTAGALFTHAKLLFTLTVGGTAWAAADTVTFVITPPWTQKRGVAGSEYIWMAPGNAGNDSIYVGALRFFDSGANYDNLRLGGFTGYDGPSAFTAQPGFVGIPGPVLPLWNAAIPYWFIANGRRVIIVAKVSTNYESAYLGWITPYASPGQFAYPLAVGGSMAWGSTEPASNSTNWRFSYTGVEHQAFPKSQTSAGGGLSGQLRLRRPDGLWRGFSTTYSISYIGCMWPYGGASVNSMMTDTRPNLDGSYPMFPIVLTEDAGSGTTNVFGEFDGVRATTGHNNAAENTVVEGRDTWLVVQNTSLTTKTDYFCVRMD